MKHSSDVNRLRVLSAALLLVSLSGIPKLEAADPIPRYGVTFGQQGNEVELQIVPARSGVGTSTMPAPDDPAVSSIVSPPATNATAIVPPKTGGTSVQLKSQAMAHYKEDGFEVSIDDIAGESFENDLSANGRLSLAILFDNDSRNVDLTDSLTLQTLNNILKLMKSQPALRIVVEGFVDYTGVKEYQALGQAPDGGQAASEARAYAVKKWLVDQGISSLRITSVGKGTRGTDGDSEEQRAKNRRVDIVKVTP